MSGEVLLVCQRCSGRSATLWSGRCALCYKAEFGAPGTPPAVCKQSFCRDCGTPFGDAEDCLSCPLDAKDIELTALRAEVARYKSALEKMEWRESGHGSVQGRRMWMCEACTMTWREKKAYTRDEQGPPHAFGCWLAPLLNRSILCGECRGYGPRDGCGVCDGTGLAKDGEK